MSELFFNLAERLLRSLFDPTLIWLALSIWLALRLRGKGFKSSRALVAFFLFYSLVLSSPYALYLASRPLENFALEKFKYADASLRDEMPCGDYEGVIALGGVIPNAEFNKVTGIQLSAGAERATEPVRIWNKCPEFKLVWSSFGKSIDDGPGESELVRDLWISFGVPKSKIIIENGSTNTRENAIETKKLLGGDKRWLLVSSASHLKRAHATFTKAGLKVNPIPVDYLFEQRPQIWLISPLSTVSGWNGVVHEYVGGIYYAFKNWI